MAVFKPYSVLEKLGSFVGIAFKLKLLYYNSRLYLQCEMFAKEFYFSFDRINKRHIKILKLNSFKRLLLILF